MPDLWNDGDPYERYIGRWSRLVAPEFLSWLDVPSAQRWLDVGCGTGALTGAILDGCAPASVTGVEPSEGFLEVAKRNLGSRAHLLSGSATSIPLPDASVDVVVFGLVLNFVGDTHAALTEAARVARDGGTIAAYVWDYADKMELQRYFWDAAAELDDAAKALAEANRFSLCNPEALSAAFTSAGIRGVDTRAIDIPTPFATFDDYWAPFLGGQGPAPAYTVALDELSRERLRQRLKASIPTDADGSINLIARAWAVRATT